MKKFFVTICAAALLMTGCGGGEQVAQDKPANNFSGETVKLGMIGRLNTNESQMENLLAKIEEKTSLKGKQHNQPKFFDNLKQMQLAVDSGTVDQISLYKCVADYLVATNDKYEIVDNAALSKITDLFCFAVRKDDTELKTELDKAVNDMKADGTLDKLVQEYITDVKSDNVPKVDLPHVDGAQTIKVGVTGDLPPLDLIMPDNTPAGFNTAILAEISKRINRNIEVVQIESGARAAALTSKLIDVIFWVVVPFGNDDIPADIDKPEGLELSAPYFKDTITHIKLKGDK